MTCDASGFMSSALAGQMSAQLPQPRQSRMSTWILYLHPGNSFPLTSTAPNPSGAFACSCSSSKKGRIAAWGQTIEHWLHWMHLSAFHSGTFTATPRFS